MWEESKMMKVRDINYRKRIENISLNSLAGVRISAVCEGILNMVEVQSTEVKGVSYEIKNI